MTKNADCEGKQTVRVYSADGKEIGSTYPKRAKGLVKKGRAHYDANGCDIHLNVSEVNNITEESTMMDNNTNINLNKEQPKEAVNRLYFNAREWSFNKACTDNVGSRSFMTGPDGSLSEAFMIGDWGYHWTEIVSKTLMLPKNTLNTFTFWLNGGENDNNNEICRFEVIYNDDWENRYSYNLNRSFIKPLKKVNGWELYEIPFRTGDNEYTQLRFVAQRAYMTVMAAQDVSAYTDLPDSTDEYEQYRPQRHNIVFEDGWPTNTWYSTRKLAAQYGNNGNNSTTSQPKEVSNGITRSNPFIIPNAAPAIPAIDDTADFIQAMAAQAFAGLDFSQLKEEIKSAMRDSLANTANISPDDIEDMISDALDNIDDAFSDAADALNDAVDNINDSIDELRETLNNMDEG